MEQLPPWPTSVFENDPTSTTEERTGLCKTTNGKFIQTVKKWRAEAENIMMEIDTETENVQMDLLSAREFLTNSTLMEARAVELKTSCKNHSKEM